MENLGNNEFCKIVGIINVQARFVLFFQTNRLFDMGITMFFRHLKIVPSAFENGPF